MNNIIEEFTIDPNKWIAKNRTFNSQIGEECDVVISSYKDSNSIRFFNKSDKKISQTGYLTIQPCKSRLYFMEADSTIGFKITGHSTRENENKVVQICKKKFPLEPLAFGNYHLEYDTKNKLYFIDKRNKITKGE